MYVSNCLSMLIYTCTYIILYIMYIISALTYYLSVCALGGGARERVQVVLDGVGGGDLGSRSVRVVCVRARVCVCVCACVCTRGVGVYLCVCVGTV